MAFPKKFHYEDSKSATHQKIYANKTASELVFKSMVTGHTVTFKAFVVDFNQQMQSTWNTEEVFGRMDPLATFQGTKRSISLGWVVPSVNISEAKNNAKMINGLVAMLYPGYSKDSVKVDGTTVTSASSIARPPLIKVKFANIIRSANDEDGLLGYIDGFGINPEINLGMFIEDKNQYFKSYSITCNFNVLHQHDVGFNSDNEWLDGDGFKNWIFGAGDDES